MKYHVVIYILFVRQESFVGYITLFAPVSTLR
jgi:hypothetical protein